MILKVQKRDGRIVRFDKSLISKAIYKAMCEVGAIEEKIANDIASNIEKHTDKEYLSVNEIQILVENELMKSDMPDVARAYIIYRNKRDKARNSKSNQIIADIIAAKKNDITRENANMNADTPAGMMMKVASERTKEFVDDYLLPDDILKLVNDNILHIHDKDYYPTKSLTCLQHPVDKILAEGFRAGHGESRAAKRIETASILSCISMESVQNEMHGGQAIPAFDFYLAPYVRKTYIEEIKKLEAFFGDLAHLYQTPIPDYLYQDTNNFTGDDKLKQHAINMTVNRVHQAMEAFIHNMNTIHSRGGNQVVFSSINYGTDISAEGRCVIREMLNSTYNGVGNHATAIFPIQIWKKKRGVNFLSEDPNYDLYLLACKVTAKRFFPNFLNLDATFNQSSLWKADDSKRYKHEVATMGCVDGQEIVTYKIDETVYVKPIEQMYKHLSLLFNEKHQSEEGYKDGYFVDLNNILIQDGDKFVQCYRIICNPDKGDWYTVTLTNGRVLTVTSDHPWSVKNKGVVLTKDLCLDDEIELTDSQLAGNIKADCNTEMAWLKGFILCDGCYDEQMMSTIGMDEEDILDKYCTIFEKSIGQTMFIKEQRRGHKGNYYELKAHSNENVRTFRKELAREFGGIQKKNRTIPVFIFNSNENVRAAFLAGMVDADGYINNHRKRAKVQIGSTNKALAIQTAMLAQSFGIPAKIYENHYSSKDTTKIRYRVEFDAFKLLLQFMSSKKKIDKYSEEYELIPIKSGKVSKIEFVGKRNAKSYDVTTESEHFTVSGIRSHNCRTRVFEDRFGESTSIARGNLSFSTINLPGLALSVMNEPKEKKISIFIDKLKQAINIAGKQLYNRYQFQCTAMAKQFPLLMSGMWVGSENLKPDDEVRSVLKHGTLGVGFIGLAECLISLVGKHHGESDKAQQLGLKIITFMRDEVKKLSDHYDLNFSVLATPAEGLSGKFTAKDKVKYGIISGVTDKDYYTNSNHVPVYYHCSAAHKAKIEAPYHELTRGGHIFYVELDGDATHNIEAVMDIVNLIDKYNIGYGSINHNRNRCLDCSYEDASKGLKVCPNCGSHNIDKLQRITGYLVGTTDRWNSAKGAELEDRVTHSK
jgi:anaerobic ribonucleoside-triphosphate reductase